MDLSNVFDPAHWQFWVAMGSILAILEVVDGSFFLFSLGVGAFITVIPVAAGLSETSLIFGTCAVIEIIVLIVLRPVLARSLKVQDKPSNVDALIGKKGVVTQGIEGFATIGYVRVESEEWRAITQDDLALEPGTSVQVQSVSGATLTVLPFEAEQPSSPVH